MAKYRVGVIGWTGRGNYGHGLDTVWKDVPDTEVVAVADPDEKGRASAAARLGVTRSYADYREMLGKEKLQIVAVAPRWLDAHRELVLACAESHTSIFLEKPLCRTLEEADQMVAACERNHVKCVIAHQTRYSPRMRQVKELIEQGAVGELLELRGRGKEDRRGGGEDLMVLGTHVMDLMRYFGGNPTWCSAQVFEGGRPVAAAQVRDGAEGIGPLAGDALDATYGFASGSARGFFSSHRPKDQSGSRYGLVLYGTRGIVDLAMGGLGSAHFCKDPTWSPARSGAPWTLISSAGLGQPEPLQDGGLHMGNVAIAKDLIKCIESDGQPLGSIYDGRAALEMILAIYESHRARTAVELPLKNRKHPLASLA